MRKSVLAVLIALFVLPPLLLAAMCNRVPLTDIPDQVHSRAVSALVAELRARAWPVPDDVLETPSAVADTCESFFLLCTPYSGRAPCPVRVRAIRSDGTSLPLWADGCVSGQRIALSPNNDPSVYPTLILHELIHIWRRETQRPLAGDRTAADNGHRDERLWLRFGSGTLEASGLRRLRAQ